VRSKDNGSPGKIADGIVTVPSAFVLTTGNVAVIGPAQAAGSWAKTNNTDAAIAALCKEALRLFIYPPINKSIQRLVGIVPAWAASYLLG
jgi:hypothetical protein